MMAIFDVYSNGRFINLKEIFWQEELSITILWTYFLLFCIKQPYLTDKLYKWQYWNAPANMSTGIQKCTLLYLPTIETQYLWRANADKMSLDIFALLDWICSLPDKIFSSFSLSLSLFSLCRKYNFTTARSNHTCHIKKKISKINCWIHHHLRWFRTKYLSPNYQPYNLLVYSMLDQLTDCFGGLVLKCKCSWDFFNTLTLEKYLFETKTKAIRYDLKNINLANYSCRVIFCSK